jgi:hypothetical protein
MGVERRRHIRVPLQLSVTVTVGNEQVPVQTWDLSLRGMRCSTDRRFKPESPCSVTCLLGAETEFFIEGSIVRCTDTEAAVFFDSMDEEAFYHLKRLVQYNMEDPDLLNTELSKES